MKKFGLIVMSAVLSGALLCGCGEGKDQNNTETAATETEAEAGDNNEVDTTDESKDEKEETKTEDAKAEEKADDTTADKVVQEKNLSEDELEQAALDIMADLDSYRIAVMFEQSYDELEDPGSEYAIEFDNAQMTRAAGYSLSVKTKEAPAVDEEMAAYYIEKGSMDEACKNLFGKEPDYSTLKDSKNCTNGLCLYNDMPMMMYSTYETDTDSVVLESGAFLENDKVIGTQTVYHGHWSGTENGESNYEVYYEFEKNNESKYGIVLKRMVFYHQEEMWDGYKSYSAPCTALPGEGFYGVWVAATKSKEDAENMVGEMTKKNLDAIAMLTSDWENLNPDPIYVVSIGFYTDEAEAKKALETAKAAGYKDAYVKFSGKRR